jgi:cold shock protein
MIFFLSLGKLKLSKMSKGVVKFFNDTKGFGFIKEDETQKEYFVHASGLIDKIRENDIVTFELEEGKKGLNAVKVKKA